MSYTYYELSLDVARNCTYVHEGTTNGAGSTSHLIDSGLLEPDGFFEGGPDTGPGLWIAAHTSTIAIAASIQRVTSHTPTALFFSPAHAYVVPTNTAYAVCKKTVPLWVIQQAINKGLQEAGEIEVSKQIWTTGEQQYTYDDDPVVAERIVRVEYGRLSADQLLDDIDTILPLDDNWMQIDTWQQQTFHDTGVAIHNARRILVFHSSYVPPDDGALRVTYLGYHPAVGVAADVIAGSIPRTWIVAKATANVLRWVAQQIGEEDPRAVDALNEALNTVQAENARWSKANVIVHHSRW